MVVVVVEDNILQPTFFVRQHHLVFGFLGFWGFVASTGTKNGFLQPQKNLGIYLTLLL
jgi:hypothetical protein